MKRTIHLIFLNILLGLLLVACSIGGNDHLSDIKRRGYIRIATDANFEPQSFINTKGEFVGFDIDTAKEIARRLGVTAQFVTPDYDVVTAGNWGDQFDMHVNSMTLTKQRQKVLDFAQPAYYYTIAQFAAVNGSGVESIENIPNQKVCVGSPTTYEFWANGDLDKLGLPESNVYRMPMKGLTVISLQSDVDCVQSIQAGRKDFAVFLTADTIIESAISKGIPIHKVGLPVFSESLSVAFDKKSSLDNSSLIQKVSNIIQEMHNDGTLRGFSITWFGKDLTQPPTH